MSRTYAIGIQREGERFCDPLPSRDQFIQCVTLLVGCDGRPVRDRTGEWPRITVTVEDDRSERRCIDCNGDYPKALETLKQRQRSFEELPYLKFSCVVRPDLDDGYSFEDCFDRQRPISPMELTIVSRKKIDGRDLTLRIPFDAHCPGCDARVAVDLNHIDSANSVKFRTPSENMTNCHASKLLHHTHYWSDNEIRILCPACHRTYGSTAFSPRFMSPEKRFVINFSIFAVEEGCLVPTLEQSVREKLESILGVPIEEYLYYRL